MVAKYLFQNQNEHKEEKAMNKKVLLLVVTAMMVIAGNVWAADIKWVGRAGTNWSDANNWDPCSVPGLADKARVNKYGSNPGPIINGVADVNQLYVAESNGAQTLQVNGGLKVEMETVLGDVNGDGKLWVTGGDVDCNQHLLVGKDPDATGRLQIDSGTVDVNQMFGLSWNGGKGYAQLNGGTLTTEQFAFENVAGGVADMNITSGTWIQKHFWWDKIRSLVWYGIIKGYGARANVVVTWNPNPDPNLEQTRVTALADPNYHHVVTVKQGGGGNYTTIQAALNDSNLVAGDVIEVRDSNIYQQNLAFRSDVNFLTLQAGSGCSPTIRLIGSDSNTLQYISMAAVGQTIQGFNIDFSGSASAADGNSAIIFSSGGATTVRDCNIVGTTGYIRGIAGVATIEDVELSNCRLGILCDANETNTGFRYSISGSHIFNIRVRGVIFSDCNAVMDKCTIERCGGTSDPVDPVGGNVLATDGNDIDILNGRSSTLNLLITNSTIREAILGRNFAMESNGVATIEDSIIMNALGTATHSDEILQYRGTLNLNRCIIKAGHRCGVNFGSPGSGVSGGVCNINHCDFWDPNLAESGNDQWAVTTTNPKAVLTIRNSILTGDYGYLRNAGTFDSNWNDNFCTSRIGSAGSVVLGPNDINLPGPGGLGWVGVDPFYIQTNNPDEPNFYALQPYSPLIHADEDGNYMGSQGVLTGQEKWPADLGGGHGVDFKDFAILALHWRDSNTIAAVNDVLLDNFESYTATGGPGQVGTLLGPNDVGDPNTWQVVPAWTDYNPGWVRGSSTLTLITVPPDSPNDVNSGTKAMRWVYDVNVIPHEANGAGVGVGYTEILVVLDDEVNFVPYNQLRLSLKRDANNSPEYETFMYAKFLNDIYGTYGKGGFSLTGPDARDIANSVVGGSTSTYPGVYNDWTINFDNLAGWTWGHNNLRHVGAIIFAVRTQPAGPYGLGKGTIDVDDIRLVDLPGCSGNPAGDLNKDCRVNFADVKEFALYWLMGK